MRREDLPRKLIRRHGELHTDKVLEAVLGPRQVLHRRLHCRCRVSAVAALAPPAPWALAPVRSMLLPSMLLPSTHWLSQPQVLLLAPPLTMRSMLLPPMHWLSQPQVLLAPPLTMLLPPGRRQVPVA